MKKTIIGIIFFVLLIIASIWLVYFSSGREEQIDSEQTSETVEEEIASDDTSDDISEDFIHIGAIAAATGNASEINKSMFVALSYAVDELNSKGGILGKQVKVIPFDNESTALGSRKAAIEAAKTNVVAVIGALRSSLTLAAAEVLQEAGIPMISPTATNPKVTEVGDYIFRACFNDIFQGEVLANFARNDLGAQTAVTLTNVNRIFSITLSEVFEASFERLGGTFITNVDYLDTETDFSEVIYKIAVFNPDVIMVPSEARDVGLIIKRSRELGIDSKFIGPDSWNKRLYLYAGEHAEGGYFSTHWHEDQDNALNKDFLANYPDKSEENLQANHSLTYDSLRILADAIERAGTANRKDIRDALAHTNNLKTITGEITFNEQGDPVGKSAVILKLEDGESVFYKSVEPASETF